MVEQVQDRIQTGQKSKPVEDDLDTVMEKNRFKRPIPGQGLTNDPDSPLPYERPPEFTNYEQAQEFVFDKLLDEGPKLVHLISKGTPLETLAQLMLTSGFQQGKWNVDLMLMLIEPTLYMLLFICEAGGLDYVMSDTELEDMDADAQIKIENHMAQIFTERATRVEQEVQEEGVQESAEDVLPKSLLSRAKNISKELEGTDNV